MISLPSVPARPSDQVDLYILAGIETHPIEVHLMEVGRSPYSLDCPWVADRFEELHQ